MHQYKTNNLIATWLKHSPIHYNSWKCKAIGGHYTSIAMQQTQYTNAINLCKNALTSNHFSAFLIS